ncbi:acyltransferase [Marisediminicola antarctica]|uniref:acyltransferase n=1 Tax=Marisediminicola antarctica TaxID=674079 RepID=UPI0022B2714D|nr:acyltransferase [Marisediminicola antarctica]
MIKAILSTSGVRAVRRCRHVVLWIKAGGHLAVGREFVVGPRARVARGASIRAGSRVNIGSDFVTHDHVEIGNDVMISSSVSFIGNDHSFDELGMTIQDQKLLPRALVRLEGDNLIGFGTIILGNVTIGQGTIVGAGSLVTRDLPPNTVCVGRPARPIRNRAEK